MEYLLIFDDDVEHEELFHEIGTQFPDSSAAPVIECSSSEASIDAANVSTIPTPSEQTVLSMEDRPIKSAGGGAVTSPRKVSDTVRSAVATFLSHSAVEVPQGLIMHRDESSGTIDKGKGNQLQASVLGNFGGEG
jgi:hypothetical protein